MATLEDILDVGAHAIAAHGRESQIGMLAEECGELLTAVNRRKRGRCTDADVLEEVADVVIVALQTGLLHGDAAQVEVAIEAKLVRLVSQLVRLVGS